MLTMGSLSLTDLEWRNTSYGNTSTVEAVKLPQAEGTRAIFGAIAALSVFLNFFFCVVMIRKPVMLKSAHNILLFSLSITDLLTGILIPLTPGYVVSISSFPIPSGLAGDIFCRLLGSRYSLFTMGRVSILKVTCLAVERWFSIFRPMIYKFYFTRKRIFLYILAIWVFTCISKSNKFFEWKLLGNKCFPIKAPYGEEITQTIIFVNSIIGFCIPCMITWASFAHIALLFKTSPVARCYRKRQREQHKALLRMCAVACLTLTLCWLPAQAVYVLTPFGITSIDSPVHIVGGILAMFNSCVNPLIYWMTNKEYRDSLCEILEFSRIKRCNKKRQKMMESQMYELMVF